MKIFYKKDFQRVLEKKLELEKEFKKYKEDASNNISALEDRTFELLQENSNLKDAKLKKEVKSQEEINRLKVELSLVKDQLKEANGRKGGLTKENNKLKATKEEQEQEISILRAKISDLESDRYLIKKIPSGRTKSTVKTKIAPQMKPQVQKFMKENSK